MRPSGNPALSSLPIALLFTRQSLESTIFAPVFSQILTIRFTHSGSMSPS